MDKIGKERSRGSEQAGTGIPSGWTSNELTGVNGQIRDSEEPQAVETLRPFSIKGGKLGAPEVTAPMEAYRAPAELIDITSRRMIPASGDHTIRGLPNKLQAHRAASRATAKDKAA